jgi:hypothetical protein
MNKDNKNSEQPSAGKESDGQQQSGDLVIALITFTVFVIFMTAWMYFGETQ